MNICNHFIKTDTIIGIGPLFKCEHPDQAIKKAYGPVALSFSVYTEKSTIEIKSDYFILDQSRDKQRYTNFQDRYYVALKEVVKLIGDTEEPGRNEY